MIDPREVLKYLSTEILEYLGDFDNELQIVEDLYFQFYGPLKAASQQPNRSEITATVEAIAILPWLQQRLMDEVGNRKNKRVINVLCERSLTYRRRNSSKSYINLEMRLTELARDICEDLQHNPTKYRSPRRRCYEVAATHTLYGDNIKAESLYQLVKEMRLGIR